MVLAITCTMVPFEAIAQNPAKVDPPKTGQRFASWCKKQQNNFQNTMNSIKESQFATFIGDGIKAAKDGIAYVQQGIQYAKDALEAAKESNAYKTALLSKQIAEKGLEIKNLQEELQNNLKALQEETNIQRTSLETKIAQSQENFEITSASYQESLTKSEFGTELSEEDRAIVEEKIAEFQKSVELEIAQFNEEIAGLEQQLKQKTKEISIEFGEQIYAIGEEIADLTMQIEALYASDKEEAQKERDPKKLINNAVGRFSSNVVGGAVSLKDKARQKREARREKKEAIARSEEVVGPATEQVDNKESTQEDTSGASGTMNGDSEAVHFTIESSMAMIEGIETYLMAELLAIETETAELLSNENAQGSYQVNPNEITAFIDIKEYTGEKGGLAGIKDSIKKGKDAVNQGVQKIKAAKDGVQQLVKKAEEVGEVIKDATSAVQDLSQAGSSLVNSVGQDIGLEGMGI